MERVAEPELMDDPAHALAYALADFEAPHSAFVEDLLDRLASLPSKGHALDLGCGPGDITFRLAAALPGWGFEGLDGAEVMLALAERDARRAACGDRVSFACVRLPVMEPRRPVPDLIASNSLLHHMASPDAFWETIQHCAGPNTQVFVMDLMRPPSVDAAHGLVARYAADEPEVLRCDFFNSLLAAYRVEEVEQQLDRAGLAGLRIEVVTDRHWIAWGTVHPE